MIIMMKYWKRLTIFTPAYNRAYILPKLYESLCVQTCQDFEWLIVDDGSTDHTKELVEAWMKDGKVAIRYLYQDNSGKMMAHNKAVRESMAELFMCIDSDDHLCSDRVVEDTLSYWQQQMALVDNPMGICGLIGYKKIGDRELHFPQGMQVAHLSELFGKGFSGETSLVFRRDVLDKYPFPYFEGEKFVTDVYVYDQIDRVYKFLLFPYYMQNCEYQIGGYSNNYMKLLFDNPRGFRAYHNQCVKFRRKGYVKSVICYVALSIRIGDWKTKMFRQAASPFLTVLLFPLGVVKYLFDNQRLSHI